MILSRLLSTARASTGNSLIFKTLQCPTSSSSRHIFMPFRSFSTPPPDKSSLTIDELVKTIDTKLTPEQQEYVETLKKKIKGGPNSPRSLYRDVPRPEEITGIGNFLPKIADNAQELIDFALSHIPKKDGPRRSRFKQRLALKALAKKKQDDIRKEQTIAAKLRHDAKLKKHRLLVQHYKQEALNINSKKGATTVGAGVGGRSA